MSRWNDFLFSFFNLPVMAQYLPMVIKGMGITIVLALAVIACGLVLGFFLAAVRTAGIRPLNWLIIFIVDLFRALPPLVIILLMFFGLPLAGINMSGFVATWISLSLILMAFTEETIWAGITTVHKGQWEASRSTGMSFTATVLYVIIPQAVRMTIPSLTNRIIVITKGTALAAVVGVSDILGASQTAVSFSSNPTPLTLGAIAYLILFVPLVALSRRLGKRYTLKR